MAKTAAERQKAYRQRKKPADAVGRAAVELDASKLASYPPSDGLTFHRPGAIVRGPQLTADVIEEHNRKLREAGLHETDATAGEGATPERWMTTPTLAPPEVPEGAPADEGAAPAADPEPIAPPAEPAPEERISDEEAAVTAHFVRLYIAAGWSQILAKHGEAIAAAMPVAPVEKQPAMMGRLLDGVERAAHRFALKHNLSISIPYQDEVVLALAFGTASYGLYRKVKPSDVTRARTARDVTAPQSGESSTEAPRAAVGTAWDGIEDAEIVDEGGTP